jgi:transcriptional regulator GlxA family with amidase domain
MNKLLEIQNWEKLACEANFRPESMAALCPVSLRQLERFFSRRFHKTPNEWAKELRGRLALKLISEGWSNKAVAGKLHFWDESHFCNHFKRVYGAPPQTFAPLYGKSQPLTNLNSHSISSVCSSARKMDL